MSTKNAAAAPWQELEEQAYHAYREWPVWLVLRERELGRHLSNARLTIGRAERHSTGTARAAEGLEGDASSERDKR